MEMFSNWNHSLVRWNLYCSSNCTEYRETILAVIILAAFTIAVQAGAETAKGRTVYHFFKVERIEVGDVPGHVIGVADGRGLVSFDTGEVRQVTGTAADPMLSDRGRQTVLIDLPGRTGGYWERRSRPAQIPRMATSRSRQRFGHPNAVRR